MILAEVAKQVGNKGKAPKARVVVAKMEDKAREMARQRVQEETHGMLAV